jgi:hypothetical protein
MFTARLMQGDGLWRSRTSENTKGTALAVPGVYERTTYFISEVKNVRGWTGSRRTEVTNLLLPAADPKTHVTSVVLLATH